MRRLTTSQYKNAMTAILGEGLIFPNHLEPDIEHEGLHEIGASVTPVSATGVVRYEDAAFSLLKQVFENEDRREDLIPCTPTSGADLDCAREVVSAVAKQAWRRPASGEEIDVLIGLFETISAQAGGFNVGLEFALAAIFQSPYFLYRIEYGDENGLLTSFELASRLSFFLWNGIPDEALLLSAENGTLLTSEGLASEFDRMIADERISTGLSQMFTDFFGLHTLDTVIKDPFVFNHAHPEFGSAARDEILKSLYHLIVEEDADFREMMTTQHSFVDTRLAALYNVPATDMSGFGEVYFPESSGRRGLLGRAGILAAHSHAATTSATLRGAFIRRKLLCQVVSPAPADVESFFPETDASLPTLRERIGSHMNEPRCASCHEYLDPIGLGLENFDGIGRWRESENHVQIDASGDLDGVSFESAWELGSVVANHPNFGDCFARHAYEYATGQTLSSSEPAYHQWLARTMAYEGWSFLSMLRTMVASEAFRKAGGIQ